MATSDTEEHLAEIARFATAAQLETVVRAYRGVLQVELGDADAAHRRRWVRCEHDDDGSLLIHARLPAEEGALVLAALEAGRDAVRSSATDADRGNGGASAETTQIGDTEEEADGERAPGERTAASNADALVLMAETMLSSGPVDRSGGDRYQVVVHVDADTFASDVREAAGRREDPVCELERGPGLHPETARRLACDASVVRILERDGRPLSVGRRTRSIPPALRRALRTRDRYCRFPGCCQSRFLHAHHVEHWAHGGRTDLSNLIHLCGHHHRLVHEGGYTIGHRPNGTLRFRRPDGTTIPDAPTRPRGAERELRVMHRSAGLLVDAETCVPTVHGDRFTLPWIVDGLAEADGRMQPAAAGTDAPT